MKNYRFKKSYIQETINLYVIRFILFLVKWKFKINKSTNKILIKSTDGIGDLIIRSKLSEKIIEKYGKKNVYFLLKDTYMGVGEVLGYNCISYSRKERKNFINRLKKMYILNKMGFSKYINLEFGNDITVGNLFIPYRIGVNDYTDNVKRNNKYYTKSFDKLDNQYVLTTVTTMCNQILNENLAEKNLKPDLRNLFKVKEQGIVVQVGSSSREKVCSPIIMSEYLKGIIKISNEEVTLLGYGESQEGYAKKLEELLPGIKLNSLVGKTTMKGVFEEVAKCRLYIGFDSGLYNLAFTLKKNIIVLFRNSINISFLHKEEWIKILCSTPFEIEKNVFYDLEYTNNYMNSISIKRVINAYKELSLCVKKQ